MQKSKPLMLIDDDLVDAHSVKRALVEIGVVVDLVHLSNGEEALNYLRSEVNPKPCLILLDLNMPKMNGLEFLQEIKKDQVLCRIPIVVLTTSSDQTDIQTAFARGGVGYMTKPLDYDKFVQIIEAVSKYWGMSLLSSQVSS
jgi:CheY-like chemotaxis protein